jgi:hypothetical protein
MLRDGSPKWQTSRKDNLSESICRRAGGDAREKQQDSGDVCGEKGASEEEFDFGIFAMPCEKKLAFLQDADDRERSPSAP